jgi:hypothetical protein
MQIAGPARGLPPDETAGLTMTSKGFQYGPNKYCSQFRINLTDQQPFQ